MNGIEKAIYDVEVKRLKSKKLPIDFTEDKIHTMAEFEAYRIAKSFVKEYMEKYLEMNTQSSLN